MIPTRLQSHDAAIHPIGIFTNSSLLAQSVGVELSPFCEAPNPLV